MEKRIYLTKSQKLPRRIPVIKPSKYEGSQAFQDTENYWQAVLNELDTETELPTPEQESRQLAKVLPPELYEKVCNTLDIPIVSDTTDNESKHSADDKPRRMIKYPLLSYRKTLTIDRELDSDTDVEFSTSSREGSDEELNIHQEFLRRPEREQVTWATRYLRPEGEDEKNLVRRADDLTDRIAREFCEYMKQLGGNQPSQFFTPKAIKELFKVEQDTHAARSLRMVPRELACVQDKIAEITEAPEKAHSAALEYEISRDVAAERRPQRTAAFGRSLPGKEQWRPPRNDTRSLWRSASHVPQDLVTLKAVWEGITNLRSVREYCRWMIEHPEHRRAPYLRSLGMFDPSVLNARQPFEAQQEIPAPTPRGPSDAPDPMIDSLRRRLSQLADSEEQ